LERSWNLSTSLVSRYSERNGGVPAPPRLEDRCVEQRLHKDVAGRHGMEIPKDVRERERVLRTKRQEQRVLCCRGLQFEVELAAETLPQGEAPRLVDAAAKRRVQDELHAPGFVEESLQHESALARDHAECATGIREVRNHLICRSS